MSVIKPFRFELLAAECCYNGAFIIYDLGSKSSVRVSAREAPPLIDWLILVTGYMPFAPEKTKKEPD